MPKERPALSVNQWLASVPVARRGAIDAVRNTVNEHLPKGYVETVDWGMLAWVVPLSTLRDTHNGRPLLFAALGAHRKLMTLYLASVYGDPKLRKQFETAYKKTGKKFDMGGSCVHFKTLDDLPLDVVGDTIARIDLDKYVERYRKSRPAKKPKTAKTTRTERTKTSKAKR
jgi:hypothetical protein